MSTLKWILCVSVLYRVASEEIKSKPGEDVVLHCQSPRDADIRMLKWIKPDLRSEGFVFFFRDDLPDEYEDESFQERVELKDPQMKDGDVSVILKNVTINDAGTYECYVGYEEEPQLISTVTLTVTDSGENKDGGNKGGHVGPAVSVLLFVLVALTVGCLIYRVKKHPQSRIQTQFKPTNESQM